MNLGLCLLSYLVGKPSVLVQVQARLSEILLNPPLQKEESALEKFALNLDVVKLMLRLPLEMRLCFDRLSMNGIVFFETNRTVPKIYPSTG